MRLRVNGRFQYTAHAVMHGIEAGSFWWVFTDGVVQPDMLVGVLPGKHVVLPEADVDGDWWLYGESRSLNGLLRPLMPRLELPVSHPYNWQHKLICASAGSAYRNPTGRGATGHTYIMNTTCLPKEPPKNVASQREAMKIAKRIAVNICRLINKHKGGSGENTIAP